MDRAVALAGWAADTFGVRQVVLGGLCGTGITSIFTADRFPNVVQSLLLIEPELHITDMRREVYMRRPQASKPRNFG